MILPPPPPPPVPQFLDTLSWFLDRRHSELLEPLFLGLLLSHGRRTATAWFRAAASAADFRRVYTRISTIGRSKCDAGADPEASVPDILEAAVGRTSIEETFKDVKDSEGAGQQQRRYWRANVGAFHRCLWGDTAVEWWAWDKSQAPWCDRRAAPWDEEERRPSHADRRKALQRERLQTEFWRRWGERPCPPEIQEMVATLLRLAA